MSKRTQVKSTTVNEKFNIVPLQFQQIELPTFSEKVYSSQSFVRWGSDNKFPEFLQQLANRSAVHNAILTSKTADAFGKGLLISNEEKDLLTTAFCNHPNPFEDINSIYKKVLADYILYGVAAINVIWDRDREHIAEIYHIDAGKLRCEKKDERGVVRNYYYSDSWNKGYTASKKIPAFDIKNRVGSQILYISEYRPGNEYYTLPTYSGALTAIATDIEISNFHLSHLKNGMMPSKMITFTNGEPSEEERQATLNKITDTYSGTDNAGRILLNFAASPERVPVIDTLGGDNLGDEFIQLEASVQNQILSGHRVTSPLLIGLRTDNNGLGSNSDEILEAFTLFTNTVIKPIQEPVVKRLNDIIKYTKGYNGMILEATINTPIEFTYSEATLTQIMTKDELRERIGLEPLEEEQKNELENE